MPFLLWKTIVVIEYGLMALVAGANAAYLLARPWATRRLRAGARALALVSVGVAVQGAYIALAVLRHDLPDPTALRGWLLAGGLALAGSLIVALFFLRHHQRP